jgi:hypothetical protein
LSITLIKKILLIVKLEHKNKNLNKQRFIYHISEIFTPHNKYTYRISHWSIKFKKFNKLNKFNKFSKFRIYSIKKNNNKSTNLLKIKENFFKNICKHKQKLHKKNKKIILVFPKCNKFIKI